MALLHHFNRAAFDAAKADRAAIVTGGQAIADRSRDAVGQANAANSVPALRTIVAQLAADIAVLTDALKRLA